MKPFLTDLTDLLAHRAHEGVSLHPTPDLTIAEVVRAIDLVRSAGMDRVALP